MSLQAGKSWASLVGSKPIKVELKSEPKSVQIQEPKLTIRPFDWNGFPGLKGQGKKAHTELEQAEQAKVQAHLEAIKLQLSQKDQYAHPPIGSIFLCEGDYYLCTGDYYSLGRRFLAKPPYCMGDFQVGSGMFALDYDPIAPNYIACIALFKDDTGKFWKIPETISSFSLEGHLNPSRKWELVKQLEPPAHVKTLRVSQCKIQCPGLIGC